MDMNTKMQLIFSAGCLILAAVFLIAWVKSRGSLQGASPLYPILAFVLVIGAWQVDEGYGVFKRVFSSQATRMQIEADYALLEKVRAKRVFLRVYCAPMGEWETWDEATKNAWARFNKGRTASTRFKGCFEL